MKIEIEKILKLDFKEIEKLYLYLKNKNLKEEDIKKNLNGEFNNLEFDGNNKNYIISFENKIYNTIITYINDNFTLKIRENNKSSNEEMIVKKNKNGDFYEIKLSFFKNINDDNYYLISNNKILICEYLINKININIFKNDKIHDIILIDLKDREKKSLIEKIDTLIEMKKLTEDKDISEINIIKKSKLIDLIIKNSKQKKTYKNQN